MKTANRRQVLKAALGVAALPVAASVAQAAGHAVHTVEIQRNKFSPQSLQMEAGDRVTFINLDNVPHTATADNGAFDTPRLGKGEEATIQITSPGTYSYFCKVHPRMKAVITAT